MSRGNDKLLLVLAKVTVGQMAADRINDAASSECKCMDGYCGVAGARLNH